MYSANGTGGPPLRSVLPAAAHYSVLPAAVCFAASRSMTSQCPPILAHGSALGSHKLNTSEVHGLDAQGRSSPHGREFHLCALWRLVLHAAGCRTVRSLPLNALPAICGRDPETLLARATLCRAMQLQSAPSPGASYGTRKHGHSTVHQERCRE